MPSRLYLPWQRPRAFTVRRSRCSGDKVLVSSRDVQTRSADTGTASCLSLSPCLGLVCSVDVNVVLISLTLLTWDEMGFVKRSGHRERGKLNNPPAAGTC